MKMPHTQKPEGVFMKAIAVVDQSWGIGRNGRLLAHLSGDLKYFKETTLGQIVVMGRKTLESLPGGKPLPGRRTIVLTRQTDFEAMGAVASRSIAELFEEIERMRAEDADACSEVFVAGGGAVYAELLPYTDACLITKMENDFDADVFFPNLDADTDFSLTREEAPITEDGITYRFTEYRRRASEASEETK
jgi:dihydrofolate reductase